MVVSGLLVLQLPWYVLEHAASRYQITYQQHLPPPLPPPLRGARQGRVPNNFIIPGNIFTRRFSVEKCVRALAETVSDNEEFREFMNMHIQRVRSVHGLGLSSGPPPFPLFQFSHQEHRCVSQ